VSPGQRRRGRSAPALADLLEAHEICEHEAAPLDALGLAGDGALHLVDRLLVEPSLPARGRQNAFTSVLSGRSATIARSVLSRRNR
jgi:hypothetical protein